MNEATNANEVKPVSLPKKALSSIKALIEKGAIDILAGSFLTKIAAFLGSIILVRVLAVDDYGYLTYAENRYVYVYLLAGLGLNNAVFRYVVLAKTDEEKRGVFRFVALWGTAFNLMLVAAAAVVFAILPATQGFEAGARLIPVLLVALPLQYLFDTSTFSLRALFKNRMYALSALLAIVLVWSTKVIGARMVGLFGTAIATPVAYGIMSLLLLAYFGQRVFKGTKPTPVSSAMKKEMIVYSLQYMVTNGLWALFMQNDLLLLGSLTGDPTAVANYRVAYVIPSALSILSSSIGLFVVPYFVKHEKDRKWVWSNYKKVVLVSVGVIGLASLCVILFGASIIRFAYGEQYLPALPIMTILLVSSVINNGLRYPTANILSAMGQVRVNMAVSAAGTVLQLLLNWLLIPRYGAYGTAICSVVVYACMAVAVITYFAKANRSK